MKAHGYGFVLGMAACGYPQEDFSADYSAAVCRLYADCKVLSTLTGHEGVPACEADITKSISADAGRCPDYDRKAAEQCVNSINQMQCQAIYDNAWPEACSRACPGGAAEQDPFDTGS